MGYFWVKGTCAKTRYIYLLFFFSFKVPYCCLFPYFQRKSFLRKQSLFRCYCNVFLGRRTKVNKMSRRRRYVYFSSAKEFHKFWDISINNNGWLPASDRNNLFNPDIRAIHYLSGVVCSIIFRGREISQTKCNHSFTFFRGGLQTTCQQRTIITTTKYISFLLLQAIWRMSKFQKLNRSVTLLRPPLELEKEPE